MKLLQDRVAVISGAATQKGIGLATAQLLRNMGLPSRSWTLNGKNRSGLPPQSETPIAATSATCKRSMRSVAQQIIQDFGAVDILINNAGITQPIRIMGIQPQNYDAVLDVNLRGMLYLSQAFIPHMISRGRGSIASTSSVSAITGEGFLVAALRPSRHAWFD